MPSQFPGTDAEWQATLIIAAFLGLAVAVSVIIDHRRRKRRRRKRERYWMGDGWDE